MQTEITLRELIEKRFNPRHLELANESHQHSVPVDSETHFRLVVVSDAFSGVRKVARHQMVYQAAAELIEGPIHALAMHLYDPEEWSSRNTPAPESPACLGGSLGESRSVNDSKSGD
ncbi:MAG: BolA family protein [Pseudomonadota bacterium]